MSNISPPSHTQRRHSQNLPVAAKEEALTNTTTLKIGYRGGITSLCLMMSCKFAVRRTWLRVRLTAAAAAAVCGDGNTQTTHTYYLLVLDILMLPAVCRTVSAQIKNIPMTDAHPSRNGTTSERRGNTQHMLVCNYPNPRAMPHRPSDAPETKPAKNEQAGSEKTSTILNNARRAGPRQED